MAALAAVVPLTAQAAFDEDGHIEAGMVLANRYLACDEITGSYRKGLLRRIWDGEQFSELISDNSHRNAAPLERNDGSTVVRCSNGRDYEIHRIRSNTDTIRYRVFVRDTLTGEFKDVTP
jgi:hypothetical protein